MWLSLMTDHMHERINDDDDDDDDELPSIRVSVAGNTELRPIL